jgi:hypothetical protein
MPRVCDRGLVPDSRITPLSKLLIRYCINIESKLLIRYQ